MNIAEALDRSARFFPDADALVDADRRWSYVEYRRDADRFAHALSELGIGHGDRVCLFMGNCAEFGLVFYGILKVGAIAVSISSMCKCGEVEYMANDSEARVVVVGEAYLAELPDRSAMPFVEHVILVRSGATSGASGATAGAVDHDFWTLVSAQTEAFATAYTDRHDGAEIIYTSGTTGKPKGVVLTHGNVVANSYAHQHHTGLTRHDRLVCFLPMYHSFAQNYIFNASVQCGSALVILPRFELEAVLRVMTQEGVTRWFAVPTIYILILGAEDREAVDRAFASVNHCFSAAASMPGEIARQWYERFGLKIHEGYGLTETSPSATFNHEYRHKEGSVGTPIENVEVQVWDDQNRRLSVGDVGEIVIKGPNVMKGYYNKPEATAETIVDGWLKTGDVGMIDDEGYLFLVDRIKDMVNSAGLKIWPREVEEVLYQHAAVAECAVIGVPDPVFGESVKACIVLQPGAEVSDDDVIVYCKAHLASYKAPKIVEFMEGLPKSATGKILKTELRRLAQDGDPAGGAHVPGTVAAPGGADVAGGADFPENEDE